MLAIRVGDRVYALSESSATELISRIPHPALEGGEPVAETLEEKLRDAVQSNEAADLDRGELAVVGATIEAWATEIAVDAPDVQELREAIAEAIG